MCARAVEYLQLVFDNAIIFLSPLAMSFTQLRKQSLGLAGQSLSVALRGTFCCTFILAVVVIEQELGFIVGLRFRWLICSL